MKLGQLKGDDEQIYLIKFLKKSSYFSMVMAFCTFWAFQTYVQDFSKSVWARGLKLGALIGEDE